MLLVVLLILLLIKLLLLLIQQVAAVEGEIPAARRSAAVWHAVSTVHSACCW